MLESGKHVVIEKPLAMNPGEVRHLTSLAKQKGLFLLEGIWSRYFPVYSKLRRIIESGTIGDVKAVFVTHGTDMRHVDRVQDRSVGGGAILDIGVYAVQFVTHVFKNEDPQSVVCAGYLNDKGADIASCTGMLFKDNKMANIVLSAELNLDNCAHVVGTTGTIKICAPYSCPTKIEANVGRIEYPLPKVDLPLHYPNSEGLCYEADEVRRCLQNGLLKSEHMTHEDSLRVSTIMDSMLQQLGVQYPTF
jgi:dihydrodiol dehydrogenase / D-xylose 1-dehydrogenase (NADP)